MSEQFDSRSVKGSDKLSASETPTAQADAEDDEKSPSARTILFGACIIVLVQAIAGAAIIWQTPDLQSAGQFGDLFGAVNALFSGLAFAGLIYTAMLQRIELSLQRKELRKRRSQATALRSTVA